MKKVDPDDLLYWVFIICICLGMGSCTVKSIYNEWKQVDVKNQKQNSQRSGTSSRVSKITEKPIEART